MFAADKVLWILFRDMDYPKQKTVASRRQSAYGWASGLFKTGSPPLQTAFKAGFWKWPKDGGIKNSLIEQ